MRERVKEGGREKMGQGETSRKGSGKEEETHSSNNSLTFSALFHTGECAWLGTARGVVLILFPAIILILARHH